MRVNKDKFPSVAGSAADPKISITDFEEFEEGNKSDPFVDRVDRSYPNKKFKSYFFQSNLGLTDQIVDEDGSE